LDIDKKICRAQARAVQAVGGAVVHDRGLRVFEAFDDEHPRLSQSYLEAARLPRLVYWSTEQQYTPGLRGLAMPVKDRKGECLGAIGTTLPMRGPPLEEAVARLLPAMTDTVQTLLEVL
jgi:IclR family pca regulon transcriptional regulator